MSTEEEVIWTQMKVASTPITLTATQKDILMAMLAKKEVMTVKAIERLIDYAYIFKALREISQNVWETQEDADIEDAVRHKHIKDFIPMPIENAEFIKLAETFITSEFMLVKTKDYKTQKRTQHQIEIVLANEKNRYLFVSVVNDVFNYAIPNYRKVESELKMLKNRNITTNYIYKDTTPPRTLWGLDPLFYKVWLEAHTALQNQLDEAKKGKTNIEKVEDDILKQLGSELVDFYLLNLKEKTLSEHVSVYSAQKATMFLYLGV